MTNVGISKFWTGRYQRWPFGIITDWLWFQSKIWSKFWAQWNWSKNWHDIRLETFVKYINTANINNSIYVKKGGFLNVLMGEWFWSKSGSKRSCLLQCVQHAYRMEKTQAGFKQYVVIIWWLQHFSWNVVVDFWKGIMCVMALQWGFFSCKILSLK